MQERSLVELTARTMLGLEGAHRRDIVRKLEAQTLAADVVSEMKAEGKAFELSEEEEKMLLSFRRFKLRMRKQGEVFRWQTRLVEGVQLVEDSALIVHPQEHCER